MKTKVIGIIISFTILCWVSALLDYQLEGAEYGKSILRKEISNILDKIFTFQKEKQNREWKIIDIKVKGEKKSFLITPVYLTKDEKDALRGKELTLVWE